MFLINPYILQASGNPLWDGLQAYYTADNTGNDALGTYNGTLTNGATYGTGIINNGFSLDGVNDYVDMGNVLNFSGDTPFSFSCWINPLGSTTVNILSKFDNSGSFPGYTLHLTSNLVRFIIQNNNSTDRIRVATTSTLTSGMRHISLTYDGSTNASGVKIYVDGVNQSVNADRDTFTGGLTTGSNFEIGGFVTGFNYFDGIIDEVGVWDKELSASEVTELYNSGAGKQYPTGIDAVWSDLLAYYTADSTPNDALGNFNGTLTNGATYGTGIISNGFSLDGVNDYVDLGNNLDFDGSTPFSISCWINQTSAQAASIISKKGGTPSFTGYRLNVSSNRQIQVLFNSDFATNDRLQITTGTNSFTNGVLTMITVTYDGSKNTSGITVYVDGASVSFSTNANNLTGSISNSTTAKVGGFIAGSQYFNGIIDEVAVFNKVLSASEVTELYNSGAAKQYPN